MMTGDLSLFLIFAAGLLSFLSPCVLPLIPSYLSILGGIGLGGKAEKATGRNPGEQAPGEPVSGYSRPRLVRAAAAFILGFSVVFIVLGILISATFSLMGGIAVYINRAAGIIVIVLGLNVIFDFISFLNYEKRPFLRNLPLRKEAPRNGEPHSFMRGLPAAFIAGAAFAAGWTPCIGPVLTAILLTAGQSGKTGIAIGYLAVYSAGLGLPFFLAALFFERFLKNASRLRRHLPLIKRVSGIILIIMGIMILSGQYSSLNILSQKLIYGYIDWAQAKALPFRLLARALEWLQKF
ncbi:MAG: cytochrome c biogenesis CcdA family protein [Treponema sp.]|nr:cytochrome c biogenesis CcdA family protein [Treponema sp.]